MGSIGVGDGLKGQVNEDGNPLTTLSIAAKNDVVFAAGVASNKSGNTQIISEKGDVKFNAINKRMTADLVCRALNMAIKNKRPRQGLIVHSDRGSQYCSHAYHKIIKQHQFTGSMSGKGNCFDNAPIESFWGVLKNELVYHQDYKTRFDAVSDIIGYIELYYNQTRIQKGLDYKSPRQVWFDYYRQAA